VGGGGRSVSLEGGRTEGVDGDQEVEGFEDRVGHQRVGVEGDREVGALVAGFCSRGRATRPVERLGAVGSGRRCERPRGRCHGRTGAWGR